jgi:hypothetical protein
MWMAAPPVATTPGVASQVSALVYVNDFDGILNLCTSNFELDESVDRELIEVSCEVLGSGQSDQTLSSQQAGNSGPSAAAQRSCACRRLSCSWYRLFALAALAVLVVRVLL